MHKLKSLQQCYRQESREERRRDILIGALSVATALNELSELRSWLHLADNELAPGEMEEILLQTLLFAGFPRTIEALIVLREIYPFEQSHEPYMRFGRRDGEKICRQIYAERFQRLLQNMDSLHPDLTDWILEDGYGRVLSRPGLSLRDREYAVLTALMATGMHKQFRAHFRGCLNLGIDPDGIVWFTNLFEPIIPGDKQEEFSSAIQELIAT